MKRSGLVRFQILLLIALAGLLVWRASRSPAAPEASVALTGLGIGELYSAPFALDDGGRVRIEATGSIEEPGSRIAAAYPWILALEDRSVVWSLPADSARPEITVVSVVDTLELPAGAYVAYFTTFGPTPGSRSGGSFLGLKRHWTNDSRAWAFQLSPVDSVAIHEAMAPEDDGAAALWTSGPVGNRTRREGYIVVDAPASVHVRAVAELCSGRCDDASIVDAVSGDAVWALSTAETEPAGGMEQNRLFDGDVPLDTGVYRVLVTTDGSHAFGSWRANPPWDPSAWGMTLTSDSDDLRTFDPWEDAEPYVALLEVHNDELRRASVIVERPVQVVVDASGEFSTGGNRYDYAWIEDESRTRIWEMDYEETVPAGGDENNRRQVSFLDLAPGRYVVYYQSDGSHAYGDWRRTRPTHPERWGVAIFPVTPERGDSTAVRVVESRVDVPPPDGVNAVPPPPVPDVPSPIPAVAGETLFDATGLGNGVDRSGEFVLNRPTRIRIVALGEISRSGRMDYGWIESESGEYVWEMTPGNTHPAGGYDSNRMFDDVITLPAGRYTAHFHTDFSHAVGDFLRGAPPDPSKWGMRIVRMAE